jgi:hypothetical protein
MTIKDLNDLIGEFRKELKAVLVIILEYLQNIVDPQDFFLLRTLSARYQTLLTKDAYEAYFRARIVTLTEKRSSIESKKNAGNQLRPSQLKLLQTIPKNLAFYTSILEVDRIPLSRVSVVWLPLVYGKKLINYNSLRHPGRTEKMVDKILIEILQSELSGVIVLFIGVEKGHYIKELVEENKGPFFVKYIAPNWDQSHLDGPYAHKRACIVGRGCCDPINMARVVIAGVTPECLELVISKALISINYTRGDTL